MTGVALPGEDRVPPGPRRDLLAALHVLYEGAGKPSLRRIATGVCDGNYPDTISHEKVSALLRGEGPPRWSKVECVVRWLAAWHNPRLNPDEVAARFNRLWLAADHARPADRALPATAATPGSTAASALPVPAVAIAEDDVPSGFPGEVRLPSMVRGRGGVIRELCRGLDPQYRPGRPQVLAGRSGIGKSTIAYSVARIARHEGGQRKVWSVDAADEGQLSRDLTKVTRDLGVSEADWSRLGTRPAAELADVADRLWEQLEQEQHGWLLVIDNADNPGLLGPQDGTGFIRKTACGLLLITTRDGDTRRWPDADLIEVPPLDPQAAALVLMDLAPDAGNPVAAQALAQKLGNVPHDLKTAGIYLRQNLGSSRTFDEYRRELNHRPRGSELSLDALGRDGLPQARPLLWLAACYAPSSPIPEAILTSAPMTARQRSASPYHTHPLASLLALDHALADSDLAQYCRNGLRGLQTAELIDRSKSYDGREVIQVDPWVAEAARAAMDDGLLSPADPAPELVHASAAAAAYAFGSALDTGSSEDWPYYRMLTPHAEELLRHTAARLPPQARRELLGCMVLCIAAHIWSKAEGLAGQLSLRAMELAAELGCGDTAVYLRLRHVRAVALREQGCHAEAAEELQDILSAQLQLRDGATLLDTLHTRQELAWALGRLGRWADAEDGLGEVILLLDQRRRQRGAEQHDARVLRLHARCRTNWAVGQQGRWPEAEQGYRRLLTDRIEVLGADHPDTLDVRYNIGKALAWQGRWAAAADEWRHNMSDRARVLGDQHPDTLLTRQLVWYADGYRAWQDHDRQGSRSAADGLEQLLGIQREKRGGNHRETLETLALLTALRDGYSPAVAAIWPKDLPVPTELTRQASTGL